MFWGLGSPVKEVLYRCIIGRWSPDTVGLPSLDIHTHEAPIAQECWASVRVTMRWSRGTRFELESLPKREAHSGSRLITMQQVPCVSRIAAVVACRSSRTCWIVTIACRSKAKSLSQGSDFNDQKDMLITTILICGTAFGDAIGEQHFGMVPIDSQG